MRCDRRWWFAVLVALSCSRDQTPRNDTATANGLPPGTVGAATPAAAWDGRAGDVFAVREPGSASAWIVDPRWAESQVLDTIDTSAWNPTGVTLALIDGAVIPGTGTIRSLAVDSTCTGWPVASIDVEPAGATSWRVAFPQGRVRGIAFDSLPDMSAADSASRVRSGALAASRLPDDTLAAFRGRPYVVRQSLRFLIAPDTAATLFEVSRLVPQEASPLEEKLLILTEESAGNAARVAWSERLAGHEESMPSVELLAVLRVTATGRIALLVRRELERGFVLDWMERSPDGKWRLRWRSALDSC